MSIKQILGIDDKDIIKYGATVDAMIASVKKCWWLKINTKAVRFGPLDGARFPHIITFTYSVNGKEYCGKRWLPYYIDAPALGSHIKIYYDVNTPEKYAVNI